MDKSSTTQEVKDPSGNFVIVIGRQFGSGARSVGKILAARLGVGYYDTEIIDKAAKAEGIETRVFEAHDEKKPSVIKNLLQGLYGIADNFHTVPLSSERIYNVQSKIIQDLAKKGPCVIVGRNADFILRNHPGLVSVFLHAPIEHRVKRILRRKDAMSDEQAAEIARQHDRRREAYYNFYTGDRKWGAAYNYHLSLDTSEIDNEGVADMILEYMQRRGLSLPLEGRGKSGQHRATILSNGKPAATSGTM